MVIKEKNKMTNLLNKIDGIALGGRITAIMGPTGSGSFCLKINEKKNSYKINFVKKKKKKGKTTLLDVLGNKFLFLFLFHFFLQKCIFFSFDFLSKKSKIKKFLFERRDFGEWKGERKKLERNLRLCDAR